MSDYNENGVYRMCSSACPASSLIEATEYIRTRRRSLNPSAGLIRRAREDPNSSNEEVYIQHRRNPQDDYYPQMYHADTERERGRSTSTTRSNTRRSTYYEGVHSELLSEFYWAKLNVQIRLCDADPSLDHSVLNSMENPP